MEAIPQLATLIILLIVVPIKPIGLYCLGDEQMLCIVNNLIIFALKNKMLKKLSLFGLRTILDDLFAWYRHF